MSELAGARSPRHAWVAAWSAAILTLVIATPKLVLPGGIPLRLDDLLAFSALAILTLSWVRDLRVPEFDAVGWLLIATAAFLIADAALGSPVGGSVGTKEYLDAMRPLKFLAVYEATRTQSARDGARSAVLALAVTTMCLAVLAFLQQFMLDPTSTGPIADFSLLYREDELQSRGYFGFRAFGTFGTPADLGFVMSIVLVGSLKISSFPARVATMAAATLVLLLSGTRTFLFSIPILLVAAPIVERGTVGTRIRTVAIAMVLAALGLWVGSLLLSIDARAAIERTARSLLTLDFEADDSLRIRLRNFALAQMTFLAAPWRGVVTRDFMLPEDVGGVDSEYLLTFHRYGFIGLALLALTWFALLRRAKAASDVGQASLSTWLRWCVVLGALYGITQGALISTRIGTIVFLIGGLTAAAIRESAAPATP